MSNLADNTNIPKAAQEMEGSGDALELTQVEYPFRNYTAAPGGTVGHGTNTEGTSGGGWQRATQGMMGKSVQYAPCNASGWKISGIAGHGDRRVSHKWVRGSPARHMDPTLWESGFSFRRQRCLRHSA